MKALYLLFVVITDAEGFESLQRANDVQYKTKLECMAAKAHYKDVENRIQFFFVVRIIYILTNIKNCFNG